MGDWVWSCKPLLNKSFDPSTPSMIKVDKEGKNKKEKDQKKSSRQHARIQGHPPQKVVFHRRLSSTEGCPPLKVVFHRRSSSTEGYIPLKVFFHRWSSSTEGCPPPKAVFHQRLPSHHTKSQTPTLLRSGLKFF